MYSLRCEELWCAYSQPLPEMAVGALHAWEAGYALTSYSQEQPVPRGHM